MSTICTSFFRLLPRSLGWLIAGIWFLCRALLIAWATLAIYYSNLPWARVRLGLAIAFAAFAISGLWLSRRRHMSAAVAVLFLGVLLWWLSIAPSHHRVWRPEVAVMPRAMINGDRVHLTGVRNFEYRSRNDFTVRYEEREISLSSLTNLDFYKPQRRAGRFFSTAPGIRHRLQVRACCSSQLPATLWFPSAAHLKSRHIGPT